MRLLPRMAGLFLLSMLVGFVFLGIWLFWAKLWSLWSKHFGYADVDPQIFGMLEVFIAAVATAVAFVTFLNERERRRVERAEEKEAATREAKRTQAAFLAQTIPFFLDKLREFSLAQDGVEWEGKRGIAALNSCLYDPFRKRERDAWRASDAAELDRIDREFESRCRELDLERVAAPLWELLNWVMYQQLFLDTFSGQKDSPGVDEKPLRDAYLTVLAATCVLPPSLQYVFGKYRHVRYKLGILPTAGGRILDAAHGYRGTDYADVVFLYRPTLLRLVPSPQKEKLLHLADERDAKEFGA